MAGNLVYKQWRGLGGLSNEAKRNAKADLLRTCPRGLTKLRNKIYNATPSPRYILYTFVGRSFFIRQMSKRIHFQFLCHTIDTRIIVRLVERVD